MDRLEPPGPDAVHLQVVERALPAAALERREPGLRRLEAEGGSCGGVAGKGAVGGGTTYRTCQPAPLSQYGLVHASPEFAVGY
jgi:hypothetical protein